MFRNRIFLFLVAITILFVGVNIFLDQQASSSSHLVSPPDIFGPYTQSSYIYSESQYYTQSSYYNQSSYSGGQSQYYNQSSYSPSPSYTQGSYYSQSSYSGDSSSPDTLAEALSISNIRNQIKALQILLSEGLRARMNYTSDSLLTMTPAELTEYIRSQKDPRKILVASHNLLHPTDKLSLADTEFKYSLSQMTNGSLRAEILKVYELANRATTPQFLQQLDSDISSLNLQLSKATALILKAINEAIVLNGEATGRLTLADKITLSQNFKARLNADYDYSKSQTTNPGIISKIDERKQTLGAGYILNAIEKAKPSLNSVSTRNQGRSDSLINTASAAGCASGSVLLDLELVIIGGAGSTTYNCLDNVLMIDIGGDDTYNNGAGTGWGLGADCNDVQCTIHTNIIQVAIDMIGNDFYRCHDEFYYIDSPWVMGCGASLGSVGILMDYSGNDQYGCFWTGCGGADSFGIGILFDGTGVEGDQDYYGYGYRQNGSYGVTCWGCVGYGYDGGIGLLVDTTGGDSYYCQYGCAGYGGGYFWGVGLGLLMDGDLYGYVYCGSNCNGEGVIGISTRSVPSLPYLQATYQIYTQSAYIPYSQVTYSIYTQSAYQPYLQASYAGLCQGPQGQPGVNIGGTCYSLPSLPPPCTPPQHTWPLCIDPLPYLQATYNIYTQAAYIPYVQSSYYQQSSYYTQSGYYNQSQYYAQTAY